MVSAKRGAMPQKNETTLSLEAFNELKQITVKKICLTVLAWTRRPLFEEVVY